MKGKCDKVVKIVYSGTVILFHLNLAIIGMHNKITLLNIWKGITFILIHAISPIAVVT